MRTVKITIEVDTKTAAYLRNLGRSSMVPHGTESHVLLHVAHALADGVRRPGAWERRCVEMLFGDVQRGDPDPRYPGHQLPLDWCPNCNNGENDDGTPLGPGTCAHCGMVTP
jgi:hypothetical protein